MSGVKPITNNWRKLKTCLSVAIIATYTLLAAYVFILFIHFSQLLVESPPDKGIHHQTYSQQTKEIEKSNLGVTGGLPLLNKDDKRDNNEEKTNNTKSALDYLSDARDLAAQEGVWRASNVIALLGFIQVMIGFLGLYLIAATLKETRKASSAARKTLSEATRSADATENAEKAYLIIEFVCAFGFNGRYGDESGLSKRAQRAHFNVTPKLTNYGKSPAFEVEAEIIVEHWGAKRDVFAPRTPPSDISKPSKRIDAVGVNPIFMKAVNNINTRWYFGPQFSAEQFPESYLQIYFKVSYKDIHRRDRHIEGVASITPIASEHHGGDGPRFLGLIAGEPPEDCDISEEYLYISEDRENYIMGLCDSFDIETTIFSQDKN